VNPPRLARALLLAAAGEAHAELVAGDLHEEFLYLCEKHGRQTGNRWYAWQVMRSVPWLMQLRVRSGELTQILAAMLGVALPLLLLDRLWCFVYSQIPLKDGLDRAPAYLAVNILVVCVCAALAGSAVRSVPRAIELGFAVAAAAGFAVWGSVGAAPAAYVGAVMLGAPVSFWVVIAKRRCR
jgi:hypothetical protein